MRKKGKPFVMTRCGTRRRPETWGNGRSNIEGVLGRGQTTGPRGERGERPLGGFLGGGSESKDKGKAAGRGLVAWGDDAPVIGLGAVSWWVWRRELSGLSAPSRKILSSCG